MIWTRLVSRTIAVVVVAAALAACRASPVATTSPTPTVVAMSPTPTQKPAASETTTAPPATATAAKLAISTPRRASPTPTPSRQAASTPSPAAPTVVESIPTPPPRDLVDLRRRLEASSTPVARPTTTTSPNFPVGTDHTFWVANQIAKNYFQMHARIAAKTDHAYWYLQDGVDLPSSNVQDAANYFETRTYRTEHALFGSEWSPGIDNDVHITILVGHIPGVGGYFSTADEYTRNVNPYSNEREMIYINVDSVRPGSRGFNGTVAHEFMHMIQFNVHRWQNSWVDEGSAELAARAVTGVDSGAVGEFERQPRTQLNAWASEPADAVPHYGAAYLFMLYVSEQFGGYQSIGKIVAEPARGMASFQRFFQTLNPPRSFDQVFGDWVAANALDDSSHDGGRYRYQSLRLSMATVPGPAVGQMLQGIAQQYGATYYRVQTSGPATIVFEGTPSMQLIGANPHDAPFEWWSNRGDSIDSRLTRTVDLQAVKAATLHFWIWYDIEKDFDYGYVEASSDGGKTWRTLPASDTTNSNPNGQNYGNGFTGTSAGESPGWVPETVDLTPYAGHRILLRFEYVTDDSYNADGFAIDDIEIPEIGFKDAVANDNGWQADGFARIDNKWPERYLVEVLSPSGSHPVQRMNLDASQHGSMKIAAGETVTVAVAGLAPITTQTTTFELGLRPG